MAAASRFRATRAGRPAWRPHADLAPEQSHDTEYKSMRQFAHPQPPLHPTHPSKQVSSNSKLIANKQASASEEAAAAGSILSLLASVFRSFVLSHSVGIIDSLGLRADVVWPSWEDHLGPTSPPKTWASVPPLALYDDVWDWVKLGKIVIIVGAGAAVCFGLRPLVCLFAFAFLLVHLGVVDWRLNLECFRWGGRDIWETQVLGLGTIVIVAPKCLGIFLSMRRDIWALL